MIIDMHAHLADIRIYPQYWLDNIKNNIKKKLQLENQIEVTDAFLNSYLNNMLNDYDCNKLIEQMDKANIAKSVILQIDLGYGKEDSEYIYKITDIHRKLIEKHNERLVVFTGIDPRRGQAGIDLFEKSIKEYQFSGFKIYPPCGYEIDDLKLYPFYEICNQYRLPVLIHTGNSWDTMKRTFNYPNSILKVSNEFKEIPFILGHAALLYFQNSWNLPLLRNNIYLEISGYEKLNYNESLIKHRMKKLMKSSPNNIIYGSDWPMYRNNYQSIQFLQNLNCFDESEAQKFFYKNAMNILSLKRL